MHLGNCSADVAVKHSLFVCRNFWNNVVDNIVIWHLHLLYCSCRIGDRVQSGFKQILLQQGMSLSYAGLALIPQNEDGELHL